jgi:hypothetical protein
MPRSTGNSAGGVRLDMLGRGFALVHTPRFLDDDLFRRLRTSRMVLPFHCPRWWKFPQLARYGCWLEGLLERALPEESLALVALEFRHEPAGMVDPETDRLHADGSYLRSGYTPYGRATIYRDGPAEQPVSSGQTLLMTAANRTRALGLPCTLHRRPGAGPERAVIVCSFEPRGEQLQPANVLRRVAREHRPRRRS